MISDTAVIAYSIDCEIKRVHYQQNQSYSCPKDLRVASKNYKSTSKWMKICFTIIQQNKDQAEATGLNSYYDIDNISKGYQLKQTTNPYDIIQ